MPQTKAQQDGLSYEEEFAEKIGGKATVGSGNKWYAKLDVGDRIILWSLKHTGKESLRVSKEILRETIQEATKIGSKGAIPGLAVDIAGEDFVVLRADDFISLFEESGYTVPKSNPNQRRERAKIPVALRHVMEDEDDN